MEDAEELGGVRDAGEEAGIGGFDDGDGTFAERTTWLAIITSTSAWAATWR